MYGLFNLINYCTNPQYISEATDANNCIGVAEMFSLCVY